METFSALLAFVRGIHRSPVNSPHKGQWRGALMFTLICARTNSWVNNREAGDLRRYRAHYDVIVMARVILQLVKFISTWWRHIIRLWHHIIWSTLAQLRKCCQSALSHNLNTGTNLSISSLKTKDRQFDNIVVTGGTVSGHKNNFRCHHWRRNCQIDHLWFSVLDHDEQSSFCTANSTLGLHMLYNNHLCTACYTSRAYTTMSIPSTNLCLTH